MTQSSRTLWTRKLKGLPIPATQQMPVRAGNRLLQGRVLGIDPSLRGTGLAVVEVSGGLIRLLHSQRITIASSQDFASCLGRIAHEVEQVMKAFAPEAFALEATIYVQNARVAQILGAARGAAIATLSRLGASTIIEYAPTRIKQAITGSGRASKEQVHRTVASLLATASFPSLDESDAAAVALCHAFTCR